MAFCEQCGAVLAAGIRFCEQCGAAVPGFSAAMVAEPAVSASSVVKHGFDGLDSFASSDWKSRWASIAKDCNGTELGLVISNFGVLSNQLSCSELQLRQLVGDFIQSANERGVRYHYLDLGNNAIECVNCRETSSVIKLLKSIVEVARPKYVFILGNEEVVAVHSWKNQIPQEDATVDADLPYVTLDLNSPWQGQNYDFKKVLRVGRLPSYAGESFEAFAAYFGYVKFSENDFASIKSYALSAKTWEDASNSVYHKFNSASVYTSPQVVLANVMQTIPAGANLLYFNLHGGAAESQKEWYGETNSPQRMVPPAFSPEKVRMLQAPYIIGVEACYGARYIDGLTAETSILLAAMQSGCVSLLGSSKIAYGTPCAPGSCADIIVGEFLKNIVKGESAGDSYCLAMTTLMAGHINNQSIKTLAEFSLYGDPSIKAKPGQAISKSMGTNVASQPESKSLFSRVFGGSFERGLHVPMPDIRRATQLALSKVDVRAMIADSISNHVYGRYTHMRGVQPTFYKTADGLMANFCSKDAAGNLQVVCLYTDDQGKVLEELVSK